MPKKSFRSSLFTLGLCATLSPWITSTQALAQGAIIPVDEEEAEGVPHIVIAGETALEIEFEGVLPTPNTELTSLFPQFASVFAAEPDIPTLVVVVPDAGLVPAPPSGDLVAEFISNPVSGLSSGLLNDDNGFESEDLAPGSNITISFSPAAEGSDAFFLLLGSEAVTNITTGIGTPPIFVEDELFTGSNIAAAFVLGDSFDIHPLFGLQAPEDELESFIGSALIEATVTDAAGILSGTESFRFLITNDPAAFVIPEPTTAGLLAGAGLLALRRRRSA